MKTIRLVGTKQVNVFLFFILTLTLHSSLPAALEVPLVFVITPVLCTCRNDASMTLEGSKGKGSKEEKREEKGGGGRGVIPYF